MSNNIGNMNEPEHFDGLAHLTEHCLLGTGSKKYLKPE